MLMVTERPDTSRLKNLKITMAYTVCQGQQHHSRAIWKNLKITIPVKLAEQWNEPTSCCTGTIKGQFLSLSTQCGTSSFLPTSLNTTDELQRHIHPASGEQSEVLSTFSKKKYNSFHCGSIYRTVFTLFTCQSWSDTESFASANLWEWSFWEQVAERHQFPSIIPGWADNLCCQYTAEQVSCFLSDFSVTSQASYTCRIDKALCRSTKSLVCTHHTWHAEMQMCIQFHMSWRPTSQQRKSAALHQNLC